MRLEIAIPGEEWRAHPPSGYLPVTKRCLPPSSCRVSTGPDETRLTSDVSQCGEEREKRERKREERERKRERQEREEREKRREREEREREKREREEREDSERREKRGERETASLPTPSD